MASAPPVNVPMPKVQGPMPGVEAASLTPGFLLVPLEASVAQKNAEELEAAILAGNVEKAQKIVKILAESHAPVNVKFDSTSHERMAKDKEISVTVHVEDRESPSIPLSDIKVRPSDTILDLKRMFWGKFGFPVEVQKWIIGHRICSDEQTLNKCEVNTSGHTLYLYLLSARAVNISRSTYRPKCQCRNSQDCETLNHSMASSSAPPPPTAGGTLSQTQGPQEFTLTPPQGLGQGQISPQGSVSRQPSQKSIHSSSSSLAASSSARSLSESQDLDPRSGPVSSHRGSFTRQSQSQGEPLSAPSVVRAGGGGDDGRGRLQAAPVVSHGAEDDDDDESSHQGWHCEKCTLINQPTRPGCEMCGAARPASYKIPANYIASVEELARLDRDKQLEAAAQQGWFLGQGSPGEAAPHTFNSQLTTQQLDELLRTNDRVNTLYGNASQAGSSVDYSELPPASMLVPSGVQQSVRQPTQNRDFGEDVVDSLWVLEGEATGGSHA